MPSASLYWFLSRCSLGKSKVVSKFSDTEGSDAKLDLSWRWKVPENLVEAARCEQGQGVLSGGQKALLDVGTLRDFCCLFRTHMATAEVTGQMTSPPIPLPLTQDLPTPGTPTPTLLCVQIFPLTWLGHSFKDLKAYGGLRIKTEET